MVCVRADVFGFPHHPLGLLPGLVNAIAIFQEHQPALQEFRFRQAEEVLGRHLAVPHTEVFG